MQTADAPHATDNLSDFSSNKVSITEILKISDENLLSFSDFACLEKFETWFFAELDSLQTCLSVEKRTAKCPSRATEKAKIKFHILDRDVHAKRPKWGEKSNLKFFRSRLVLNFFSVSRFNSPTLWTCTSLFHSINNIFHFARLQQVSLSFCKSSSLLMMHLQLIFISQSVAIALK